MSTAPIERRKHRPQGFERESDMPHVTVRMYAGRTEEDKQRLAEAIGQALMQTLGSSERSISVTIEDVPPDDWMAQVYEPEITAKDDRLYKRPGYGPAAG
ncbi:MAG: tautomerase family protein [Caulobacteraceae bacterium]